MSRREGRNLAGRKAGAGFSLVEILVVLGLIAFLTAAIVVVLPRVANTSKVAATRATIKKVDELLNDRMNAFKRWIARQDQAAGTNGVPAYVPAWTASTQYPLGATIGTPGNGQAYVCTTAGTSGTTQPGLKTGIGTTTSDNTVVWTNAIVPLAKILAVKQLFRQNFPQSYAELLLPPWQATAPYNVGALIHVVAPSAPIVPLTFRCTQAGQSGMSAPTWPTVPGSPGPKVSDNTVVWQLIPFNAGAPSQWTGRTTESAACLYMILTQAAQFDTEPQAAVDLRAAELADSDGGPNNAGDGLMELVDAWGNPLRFYRWPTRLIRPATTPATPQSISAGGYSIQVNPQWTVTFNGAPAPVTAQALMSSITVPTSPTTLTLLLEQSTPIVQDLAKDPDDPSGLIQAAMQQATPLFTPAQFEATYHTPDTYSTPLVLSPGPADLGVDGQLLGLFEPYDTANFGNLAQPRVSTTSPQGQTAVFGYITNRQK